MRLALAILFLAGPLFGQTPVPAVNIRTQWFVATATDADGRTSDFSNAVAATNRPPLTLAWMPSASTGITNYSILSGREPGIYTRTNFAGTNLSLTLRPAIPPDLVISFSFAPIVLTNPSGNEFFGLFSSTDLRTWKLRGWATYTQTNMRK